MTYTTSRKQLEDGPINSTQARPLTEAQPPKTRAAGRPEKLVMPPLPAMKMTPLEQDLYDYFLASYQQEYPDLSSTDHLHLHLAAVEYVKYLRVIGYELESGQVITMSRQHPGVQMRALLDQLSVTRKARTAGRKPEEDPDAKKLQDFLMGLSARPKRAGGGGGGSS